MGSYLSVSGNLLSTLAILIPHVSFLLGHCRHIILLAGEYSLLKKDTPRTMAKTFIKSPSRQANSIFLESFGDFLYLTRQSHASAPNQDIYQRPPDSYGANNSKATQKQKTRRRQAIVQRLRGTGLDLYIRQKQTTNMHTKSQGSCFLILAAAVLHNGPRRLFQQTLNLIRQFSPRLYQSSKYYRITRVKKLTPNLCKDPPWSHIEHSNYEVISSHFPLRHLFRNNIHPPY